MEQISEFTNDVIEKLQAYVYRLVDPRNGKTFYVGKGRGNRVFAHAKEALRNYNGNNCFNENEQYSTKADEEESLKYRTIREIGDNGLDVICIIQKYGLSDRDAFIIESSLIDAYSLENNLTNKIKGFDSSIEPKNVVTLQRDLAAEEYIDSPENPKYMIIKVKDYWLNKNNNDRYETTRFAWKINREQAKQYPYVLSVTNGVVREVYKVSEWHPCNDESGRSEFTGERAEPEIANIFKDKRIPEKYRKKGQASPVLYCKI